MILDNRTVAAEILSQNRLPDDSVVVYAVAVQPDEKPDDPKYTDVADAYAIVRSPELSRHGGGCMVFAKWGANWIPNPYTARWIVNHLLTRLEAP